jgi:HSP20 family protein
MPTTTETAEMQDTTTQTTPSQQQTGSQPAAGAGGGQVASAQPSPGMSRRDPWMGGLGNPFAMMQSFADEMDRLFESFGFGRSSRLAGNTALDRPSSQGQGLWAPQIEVSRRGNELVVCADLPGLRKEDLHVEFREDHLVLQGERRQEYEGGEGGFYRSERSYGRFYRAIPLPEGTNPEQAQASFKDGVLEIKLPLPQQPEQRTRQIEIR